MVTQDKRLRQAIRHRQAQDKLELERAILEAASKLFLEQGYEGFSLRQVAEAVGYSPSVIYAYFNDKDDLLFRVVDAGFERFSRQIDRAVSSAKDARERLLALMQAYVDFGLENPGYYQLMFVQRTDFLTRRANESSKTLYEQTWQLLQQVVEEAMSVGILRKADVQVCSNTIWASIHGFVMLSNRMSSFSNPSHRKEVIENLFQMILKGL